MKKVCVFFAACLLTACSLGAPKEEATAYDLGAAPAAEVAKLRIKPSLLVHSVAAPSWLDSYAIVYRLNYQDPSRQLSYANSRWAAPAGALITQRLRTQLALVSDGGIVNLADGARAEYALRVELEEFNQVFDSTQASRGVAVARASLINVSRRSLVAQKTFTAEKPAGSANAEGGVRALAGASGELVDAIVAWTAANLQDKN